MRFLGFVAALAGCGIDPAPAPLPGQAPPPCATPLSTTGYAMEGAPFSVDLCGLNVGLRYGVYGSVAVAPPAACPPELGGMCLGLGVPAVALATATATSTSLRVSLNAPVGPTQLRLQLVREMRVGRPSRSEVVTVALLRVGGDADGDGLPNEGEHASGLDPLDPDTDGDGLDDGIEVGLGTEPLRADTDRDGLMDGDEVTRGTDPLATDTDGDGLSDGRDVAAGADPRRADTDGDGLSDGDEVDVFRTSPARADTDRDGLGDGDELQRGTDPLDRDSDDDGLSDGVEVGLGFDPLDDDPDGDGLRDDRERQRGSDPFNPNTDGDRLDDLKEYERGSDLLDPADPFPWEVLDTGDGGCAPGEVLSCWGACVADARGDQDCDRWFACDRYHDDLGDCAGGLPAPACAAGTIADCLGGCSPVVWLADGACDGEMACPMRGWDEGDCAAPPGLVYPGSVIVDSAAAAAALVGVGQIDGTLVVQAGAPDPLILPDLVAVGGLRVTSGPTDVSLPSLRVLGGDAEISSPQLVTLSLPVLELAVRGLLVDGAAALQRVSVPALRSVGDGLRLEDAPSFVALEADALEEVGQISVGGEVNYAAIELPSLREVRGDILLWQSNPSALSAPVLATVRGEVRADFVSGAPSLLLPSLTSPLRLSGRSSHLGDLDLSAVGFVEYVRLTGSVGVLDLAGLIAAEVIDVDAATLNAPRLVEVGELRSFGVGPLRLPALVEVGTWESRSASIEAPVLVHAVRLTASSRSAPLVVDLPALETVERGINLRTASSSPTHIALPSLRQAVTVDPPATPFGIGDATCPLLVSGSSGVTTVELPVLEVAGCLDLRAGVSAPALRSAWGLSVRGATPPPPLPLLTRVDRLVAERADLTVPALTRVGHLTLRSGGDTAAFAALTDVDILAALNASSVDLPNLRRLGATYARPQLPTAWTELDDEPDGLIVGPDVAEVVLPALESAGAVSISEMAAERELMVAVVASLTGPPAAVGLTLRLPALQRVGALDLIHDRRFVAVELPALTTLDGKLRVHDAPALTRVSAPALVATGAEGWVNLVNLPNLVDVDLPALRTIGRLALVDVGLTTFELPGLVTALDHLTAYRNPALTAWRLPNVTTALEVYLTDNTVLTDVDLSALTAADRLTVLRHPALDVCALVAALSGASFADVDLDVTCP
jgi:hypothetical protein